MASTLLVGLCGCGSGPGGALALMPTRHDLTDTAAAFRAWVQHPAPVPRELHKAVVPDYIIEPGDVLLVEPAEFASPLRLPADQTVLPDGTIDLGRFGRPVVAGMTLEGIEEQVETLIRAAGPTDGEDPLSDEQTEVNVRLIAPNAAVVYVLGEVNSPGLYPITGRETVLDVLLLAGGLSDRASLCDIILSRPTSPPECRVVLPVCYDQIVQLGDTTTNYQVMPGDRVFVATKSCGESIASFFGRKADCPHCPCEQCGTGPFPPAFPAPVHYEQSPATSMHPPGEAALDEIPTELAPAPQLELVPERENRVPSLQLQ